MFLVCLLVCLLVCWCGEEVPGPCWLFGCLVHLSKVDIGPMSQLGYKTYIIGWILDLYHRLDIGPMS